jgi:hypothetical protein
MFIIVLITCVASMIRKMISRALLSRRQRQLYLAYRGLLASLFKPVMNGTTYLAKEMQAQSGMLSSEEVFHLSDSTYLFAGPEDE